MLWRFLHNCVAHPLLFIANDARWAVHFHDYTSDRMKIRYPKRWMRISEDSLMSNSTADRERA